MRYGSWTWATFVATTLMAAVCVMAQQNPAVAPSATDASTTSVDLRVGWKLIKEGLAEGQVEQDANHPATDKAHLLRIEVTRHPGPGEGRAGATNDIGLNVEEGRWYDITFAGVTDRGSIGLVFSLESADGRVLARTTLPEVGRMLRRPPGPGPGSGPATRPATTPTTGPATLTAVPRWANYLVSLHARSTDSGAHLVVYPIEPTNVWLEGLKLTPRPTPANEVRPGANPNQQRKEQP